MIQETCPVRQELFSGSCSRYKVAGCKWKVAGIVWRPATLQPNEPHTLSNKGCSPAILKTRWWVDGKR